MKEQLLFFCLLLILFSCEHSSFEQDSLSSVDQRIEQKVDSVLSKMSLDEKVGQLALRGRSSRGTDQLPEELLEAVRNGEIGAFLNVMDTSHMRQLQYVARYESKSKGMPFLDS